MKRCGASIGVIALFLSGLAFGESHDDSFTKEGLFKANIADLHDTQLVAHPDVPLVATKNVLWCGTLQLAWNKVIDLLGEKPRFAQASRTVELLNREDFTAADLDPASYVALADFEHNHVEDEIRAALARTFHGDASPELVPTTPPHPGPDDFVAYAYLYKNLAFAHPFGQGTMTFGGKVVKDFDFGGKPRGEVMKQVTIVDYQSPDDFVISLATKSPADELILAKVAPGATLQATIDGVLSRLDANRGVPAHGEDELSVPILNFDLRRDFPELAGLALTPGPTAKIRDHDLVITKAEQLVRFQLNENGAVLKSEAAISVGGAAMPLGFRHELVFDQPFLILLRQAGSPVPYFALWVGNTTLLQQAEEEP